MRTATYRRTAAALAAAALLALSACSYTETPLPKEPDPTEATAPAPATCETTDADLRSYAASREGGAAVERVRRAKVLRVGVSADTLRMGARNPETNKIEGFDIAIAQRIADELGVKLQTRVITAAERIPLLESGEIDLVARNFTINCARWQDIAFSAEYYRSGQKVLLRSDLAADYTGPADLAGVTVCAPGGTTSLDNITAEQPEAEPVTAANHTGCLVKFQQGEVDAITGDDTVLAGLAAQDELYAVVPDQEAFTREPYGIGANDEDTDLVAFVNAVLQEMRTDGSWQSAYDTWLRPYLGEGSQPQPAYGR